MNKKPFNSTGIENELKGASLFFPTVEKKQAPQRSKAVQKRVEGAQPLPQVLEKKNRALAGPAQNAETEAIKAGSDFADPRAQPIAQPTAQSNVNSGVENSAIPV